VPWVSLTVLDCCQEFLATSTKRSHFCLSCNRGAESRALSNNRTISSIFCLLDFFWSGGRMHIGPEAGGSRRHLCNLHFATCTALELLMTTPSCGFKCQQFALINPVASGTRWTRLNSAALNNGQETKTHAPPTQKVPHSPHPPTTYSRDLLGVLYY
jgi:hypothetical protein